MSAPDEKNKRFLDEKLGGYDRKCDHALLTYVLTHGNPNDYKPMDSPVLQCGTSEIPKRSAVGIDDWNQTKGRREASINWKSAQPEGYIAIGNPLPKWNF